MAGAGGGVAVVTDSTASLPAALLDAAGIVVVPLHVVLDGEDHREGVDLGSARIVAALRAGARVTTSQPGPDAFARVYARLVARGAREIVSVHLSQELSGTVASARVAAQTAGAAVEVVDSRSVGLGLGLGVLAAAHAAAQGLGAAGAARAALACSGGASVQVAVADLDQLRRGGRLGPVAGALAGALGLRPVLAVRDGRLEVVEKVRTAARAVDRVIERSLDDASRRRRYDLGVHHLGEPERAAAVAERLRAAAPPGLGALHVAEVSAVLGAHVGPGVVAVVVADAAPPT